MVALLGGCLSVGTPRAGEGVTIPAGQALVFGRLRMLDAKTGTLEYAAFRFDPWDQPFFITGPRMTLELRQLLPPGGAVRYRSRPAADIGEDGSFAWLLPAGDYALMGNPRLLGSERFDANETGPLATFTVPEGAAAYLGTLIIEIRFDLVDLQRASEHDEAEYSVERIRVVDEHDVALAGLRQRFAAVPEPVVTRLMRPQYAVP